MKITLDEWIELEELAMKASFALSQLNNRVTQQQFAWHKRGPEAEPEILLLNKLAKRVDEAELQLGASLYFIQGEWTGGPSEDPRNHTLREPNWVGIAHRFPPEQVDKYRDPETGDIQIPHRQRSDESE